jgi:iron complex outermembrane receptor protein
MFESCGFQLQLVKMSYIYCKLNGRGASWALVLTTLACAIQTAYAQQTAATQLSPVSVTVQSGAYGTAVKGSASAVAPTQASLDATQPQSIITRDFMDLSVAPTTEYSRIVNIAPSMSGEAANGPGLGETKETLRGFSDDQYNITFDGIPWGDTNNPAHHSTSFFPGTIIGGATVERGPGNASNLGYATFGGSINLFSKKPSREASASVFTTLGSWNTRLLGAGYESGRLDGDGETTLQLNYQNLQSDGYLSYSPIKAQNLTAKYERKLGDSSVLTLFTSVNNTKYWQPDSNKGATQTQIAKYGRNFQLDNDPTSLNYWGYNFTNKDTDFDYARIRSDLGDGWKSDNALYSYAYNNQTISTNDPTWMGTTGTNKDPRTSASGVVTVIPGIDKQNKYRVWGDIFKAVKQGDSGQLRTGVWLESSTTDRHQYDINVMNLAYNTGFEKAITGVSATATLPNSDRPINSVKFDQQSTIRTVQPFVEYAWDVTPDLQLTPGLKYINITRSQTSPVGQTTRILNDSAALTYTSTLPYLTVNQKINDSMSAYAQYAKGFQIPDLNTFYVANPSLNSTEPQKTTNYQFGVVGKSDRMTWDADVYRIEFTNKLQSVTTGTDTYFTNIGGATYQGFEGQMAYVIGGGLSAYVNGSINSAKASDTDLQLANAPEFTAALGALYSEGPWSGSLIYKMTGPVRQKDFSATKAAINGAAYYDYYQTPSYGTLDLAVAYALKGASPIGKNLKLQLNLFNVLDNSAITAISTGASVAYDTYVYQTPRSFQISLKADF